MLKKRSLEENKKASEYAKEISDKTKEMSDIQSRMAELQLAANSGDREAAKELKSLQDELSNKQDDLAKTQEDHRFETEENLLDESLSNLKDITDKQLEDAKTVYDDKVEKLKDLYAQEEALIKHASDYTQSEFARKISAINAEIQTTISQFNTGVNGNVGGGVTSGTQNIITGAQSEIASDKSTYISNNKTNSTTDAAVLALLKSGTSPTGKSELNKYIHDNYGSYLNYSEMVQLAKLLKVSGINDIKDVEGTTTNNRQRILNALKKSGFTTGGYIDGSFAAKYVGEDVAILAKHGEYMWNQADSKLFKDDFIPLMKNFTHQFKPYVPNISNITNNSANKSININFDSLVNVGTVSSDFDIITAVKQNVPEITKIITKEIKNLR
jgi:hypothetical protein